MQSDRWPLIRRYLSRLWARRLVLAAMIVCMVTTAALEPLMPFMLKPLMDGGDDFIVAPGQVPYYAAIIIVLLAVATFGRNYFSSWLNATVQRDLQREMAACLVARPLGDTHRESSGKVVSRFMHYVSSLTGATLPVCVAFIQEPIKILFYTGQMFYWQWQLALIMCLAMPPTVILVYFLGLRMKKVSKRLQEEMARAQGLLSEAVALLPIMKVHGQSGGFTRIFNALRGAVLRVQVVTASGPALSMLLVGVPSVIVLFYAVAALDSGAMTRGDLAAFLVCMLLMPRSLRTLTRAAASMEGMLVAAREIFPFLDAPAEDDSGRRELQQVTGEIEFQNIVLRYDGAEKAALSGASAKIAAGETVALVGRSGAGKTSLSNLMPRFYAPQEGAVLLDGVDIREYQLKSLRGRIAIVTQQPLLFDDTIAANICYPETPSDSNRERIEKALQNASADFIDELPDGVNHYPGEGGRLLSGGQRQRIALARAFYRDAPVVILDEATSSLDSETEGKIKAAMQRLLNGRTAIIIAHHFSAVNFADRVLVMDEGKIIATGTSAELLETCSLYAEWYKAQQI